MKRLFFAALVVMMATMSYTASAQFTVDQAGIEKKLAKADEDSQNEKKAVKAATWISRGDAYYDAATAPTAGLYVGMDTNSALLMYGSGIAVQPVEIEGKVFDMYDFPYFDAYFADGVLYFWEANLAVGGEDAMDVAVDSYVMALEKDSKVASRVANKITAVSDHYKAIGGNYFQAKKYADAASNFVKSYEICALPAVGVIDTMSLYNAGYLYSATNDFQNGINALEKAAEYGYEAEGESQFLRGICYIGLEKYSEAEAVLYDGIKKYPANSRIVEGLMSLYATTGEDPSAVIPYVEAAITADPTNYVYYDGLGLIYDKLGDDDKCLEAFQKSAELAPEEFTTQFNLGMLYIRKGNSMYDVIRELPNASQADYDNAQIQQTEYFKAAIEPLEKSLAINPNSYDAVQGLKNITFRLREQEGMQALYDKYDAMLSGMSE